MSRPSHNGFTIMELIVIVVIVGVLAGIAIPNYVRTIERNYAQDATLQLSAIHAAQMIYFARMGSYWPTDANTHDLTSINTDLKLNIIPSGMTYTCQSDTSGASTFTCTAVRTPGSAFTVTVTQIPLAAGNPVCTGTCP